MAIISSGFVKSQKKLKKTRQGDGRGTKFGTKPEGRASKKQLQSYKKKSRGQGK